MNATLLQEKIEKLQSSARELLPDEGGPGYVYVDDFSRLNKSIHDQIDELYTQRGETTDQEAALCLSILMGYSVSMYANPDDERKKELVLKRSRCVFESISSPWIKSQLQEYLLNM